MDIVPFPGGQGFAGGDDWWEYVLTLDQVSRIDILMTMALVSEEICHALLSHDQLLLNVFEFCPETLDLLKEIKVDTLEKYAQVLVVKRGALLRNTSSCK
jgi:hypothetical protein